MKKSLRAVVGLISAAAAAGLCELLLRLAGYMPEYWLKIKTLDVDAGKLHIVLDAHLLYRVKPHSQEGINNYGYRDFDFGSKEAGRKRILVLGDSFIMSNNLAPEETIPKLLEQGLGAGYEVFNMGVSGYGPDQSYLALLHQGLGFKPDAVVLSLFAGNDFRDVELNGLFEITPSGEIQPTRTNLVKDSLPAARLQLLLNMALRRRYLDPDVENGIAAAIVQDKTAVMEEPPGPQSLRRIALMRGVLRTFKKVLSSAGVEFMVMILPSWNVFEDTRVKGALGPDACAVNERIAAQLCANEQIPYLDLTSAFYQGGGTELYDGVYQHPNRSGARLAAQALRELVLKNPPPPR
jgi:hypothetical protein